MQRDLDSYPEIYNTRRAPQPRHGGPDALRGPKGSCRSPLPGTCIIVCPPPPRQMRIRRTRR